MTSLRFNALTHPDVVDSDVHALARHMRDCARASGSLALLKNGLQQAHAVACGRLVTVAFVACLVGFGAASFV